MKTYFVVKNYNEEPKIVELMLTENETMTESILVSNTQMMNERVFHYEVGVHRVSSGLTDNIYVVCADEYGSLEDKENFELNVSFPMGQTIFGDAYFTKRKNIGDFSEVSVGMTEEEAKEVLHSFVVMDGEYLFKPLCF